MCWIVEFVTFCLAWRIAYSCLRIWHYANGESICRSWSWQKVLGRVAPFILNL